MYRGIYKIIALLLTTTPLLYAPFQTISTPGGYRYGEDVTYSPSVANDSIIRVSSSKVTLDLGGRIFTQGNTTAGLNGIVVDPNLTEVIIKNGYIQNITGTGIGVGQGCSQITVDNIVAFSCDNRAINFSGVRSAPIQESFIKDCSLLKSCRGAAGDNVLTLSHCVNVQVSNCFLNQNGINQHTIDVAHLTTCTACELINLEINDNIASSTAHAINFIDANLCTIKNCTINNLSSAAQNAYGIEVDGMFNTVQQNLIQNCYSTSTTSANTVAGISLKITASGTAILDNAITNSTALIATSSNVYVYGIEMQNRLDTITSITQFTTGSVINSATWSPDGRYVATADLAGNLRVFEFKDNRLTQAASTFSHGAIIRTTAWSPDGRYIVMGGNVSGGVHVRAFLFDGTNLTAQGTFAASDTVFGIAWSPSGRFIACGTITGPELQVIEFLGTSLLATPVATYTHAGQLRAVAWSPDEKYIAIAGLPGTGGFLVRVINFFTNGPATSALTSAADYDHGGAFIQTVDFSNRGQMIAIGGDVGTGGFYARILNFNGSSLTVIPGANINFGDIVRSVHFSNDGRYLALAGRTGGSPEVIVYSFDGTTLFQLQSYSHGAQIFSVNWSMNGIYFAIGGSAGTAGAECAIISALSFAEQCFIRNNNVDNIAGGPAAFGAARGTGISASVGKNLVIQNTNFSNSINFSFTNNIFCQYQANAQFTQPSTFFNLSFPPT